MINNQDMRAAGRRHVIRPRSNHVFNYLYIIHIAIIPDPPATSHQCSRYAHRQLLLVGEAFLAQS